MQATVFKLLQALNEIEVKGEKNLDLLLFSIQQLKDMQGKLLEDIHHEQDNPA